MYVVIYAIRRVAVYALILCSFYIVMESLLWGTCACACACMCILLHLIGCRRYILEALRVITSDYLCDQQVIVSMIYWLDGKNLYLFFDWTVFPSSIQAPPTILVQSSRVHVYKTGGNEKNGTLTLALFAWSVGELVRESPGMKPVWGWTWGPVERCLFALEAALSTGYPCDTVLISSLSGKLMDRRWKMHLVLITSVVPY